MMEEAYYCCKLMKELDRKCIIDYCPPHLTTLDVKHSAYPIYFCPFCGKKIKGSKNSVKKLKKYLIKKSNPSEANKNA